MACVLFLAGWEIQGSVGFATNGQPHSLNLYPEE
jgi:hypothetical protein